MLRLFQAERLRQTDPVTLEITVQEGLRHPIGAIALGTLVDMVALVDAEGVPKEVQAGLQGFVGRVAAEVNDLPEGPVFEKFMLDLNALPADQVPTRLREMVAREATRDARSAASKALVAGLLSSWEGVEPERVKVAGPAPRIQHAIPVNNAEEPAAVRRARIAAGGGAGKAPREPAKPAAPRQKVVLGDPERDRMITETIFERLQANGSTGLAAPVLTAGVLHRVKAKDSEAGPAEVTRVLNDLKNQARVRFSAGRWYMVSRW